MKGHDLFLRLDEGEELITSIGLIAKQIPIRSAAIVSGVGMLSFVKLGFYDLKSARYHETEFCDVYDLSVVCGNVTWWDNSPWPHVHIVFNNPAHSTFSGHVLEARCHITTELFLSTNPIHLHRQVFDGCPVPRIVKKRK